MINMPEGQGRKPSIDVLTGWRAVAAYSVLLAHALDASFFFAGVPIFHPFDARLAYFGMSLFFVLSGFVIQYNYADSFGKEAVPTAAYKFFVARFARLYPLYAISIIASPKPPLSEHIGVAVAYLTLTQSWFNVQMAIFPPDWSISTEWFFYLAFVPITYLVARLNHPRLTLIIFTLVAFFTLALVFCLMEVPLVMLVQRWLWTDKLVSASAEEWLSYFSPLVRLPEFIVGVLTAKVYCSVKLRSPETRGWAPILLFVAGLWCVSVVVIPAITKFPLLEKLASNFIYAPAIATLLLLTCVADTRLGRVLSSPYVLLGGEMSYSVYVWSFFVMIGLADILNLTTPTPNAMFLAGAKVGVCIILTTVIAFGSYCLIEAPLRQWIRAALTPRMRIIA